MLAVLWAFLRQHYQRWLRSDLRLLLLLHRLLHKQRWQRLLHLLPRRHVPAPRQPMPQ
jgi:hypothetical protein